MTSMSLMVRMGLKISGSQMMKVMKFLGQLGVSAHVLQYSKNINNTLFKLEAIPSSNFYIDLQSSKIAGITIKVSFLWYA